MGAGADSGNLGRQRGSRDGSVVTHKGQSSKEISHGRWDQASHSETVAQTGEGPCRVTLEQRRWAGRSSQHTQKTQVPAAEGTGAWGSTVTDM